MCHPVSFYMLCTFFASLGRRSSCGGPSRSTAATLRSMDGPTGSKMVSQRVLQQLIPNKRGRKKGKCQLN